MFCQVRRFAWLTTVFGLLFAPALFADDSASEGRQQAIKLLKKTVQAAKKVDQHTVALMSTAAQQAAEQLGPDHYAAEMLTSVITQADNADSLQQQHQILRQGMKDTHESLTFSPLNEAKLPVGYPKPTAVHQIEIKTIPEYRLARVSMDSTGDGSAFWSLFQHIKRNDIAMTAPVEIEYDSTDAKSGEKSMAFLYRSVEQGATGADPKNDNVNVVDNPGITVVSIGCRGKMSDDNVAEAELKLKNWLDENGADYVVTGPLRKLGYNSPMVPNFMKYFEVQLPVEKK